MLLRLSVVTVASYTMSLVMQCSSSWHVLLFLHVQASMVSLVGGFFLMMCVLCLYIMDLTLLMQLLLTITVFLLKIICSFLLSMENGYLLGGGNHVLCLF